MEQFIEQEIARFQSKFGHSKPAAPAEVSTPAPTQQEITRPGVTKMQVQTLKLTAKSSSSSEESAAEYSDSSSSSEETPPVVNPRAAAYARVASRFQPRQQSAPIPIPQSRGRGLFNLWS